MGHFYPSSRFDRPKCQTIFVVRVCVKASTEGQCQLLGFQPAGNIQPKGTLKVGVLRLGVLFWDVNFWDRPDKNDPKWNMGSICPYAKLQKCLKTFEKLRIGQK